jgi:hypothetical protein
MSQTTANAIIAAENYDFWGYSKTSQYIKANHIPLQLFLLARRIIKGIS